MMRLLYIELLAVLADWPDHSALNGRYKFCTVHRLGLEI